jgi:hypothetical protein
MPAQVKRRLTGRAGVYPNQKTAFCEAGSSHPGSTTDCGIGNGLDVPTCALELPLQDMFQQHLELVRASLVAGRHQTPAHDITVPGNENDHLSGGWKEYGNRTASIGALSQVSDLPFDPFPIGSRQGGRQLMAVHHVSFPRSADH